MIATTVFIAFISLLAFLSPATAQMLSGPSATTDAFAWLPDDDNVIHEYDMSAEPHIVGGRFSDRGEFPWFATSSGNYYCGASLIHKDVLLTAAHCTNAFRKGLSVYVGAYRRDSTSGGATLRTIESVHPHPDYDAGTISNDWMLLKLNRPVTSVTPIQLNSDPSYPDDGTRVTVMGFGQTQEEGSVSYALKDVDIFTVNHDVCAAQHKDVTTPDGSKAVIREDTMLCAGVPNGGKNSCSGDSGGPLVTQDGIQVGVVSFGVGCARAEFASVFARVSGAIDWIDETVCDISDDPPSKCSGEDDDDEDDDNEDDDDEDDDNEDNDNGDNDNEDDDNEDNDNEGGGDGDVDDDKNDSDKPDEPDNDDKDNDKTEPGSAKVMIRVAFDYFFEETSWTVTKHSEVIFKGPDYTPHPYLVRDTIYPDFPTGETTFTIYDAYGDGMGSQYDGKDGYFEIWLLAEDEDGEDVLLASGNHEFTYSQSVTFTVPNMKNGEGMCVDEDGDVVDVNDSETKSCSWLAENLFSHEYLCDWIDVAIACPMTCGSCNDVGGLSCQDKPGTVTMALGVGKKSCSWLADSMNRYEFVCDRTEVAFHCPLTCKTSGCQ